MKSSGALVLVLVAVAGGFLYANRAQVTASLTGEPVPEPLDPGAAPLTSGRRRKLDRALSGIGIAAGGIGGAVSGITTALNARGA